MQTATRPYFIAAAVAGNAPRARAPPPPSEFNDTPAPSEPQLIDPPVDDELYPVDPPGDDWMG